jgi:hypothetical protein
VTGRTPAAAMVGTRADRVRSNNGYTTWLIIRFASRTA